MSDADPLRGAAHHLLAAARPNNPNPTPSTLAAALALSQAGLRVTEVSTTDTAQIIRGHAATGARLWLDARLLSGLGVVTAVTAPDGKVTSALHDNADALTAALCALLEPPGLEVGP